MQPAPQPQLRRPAPQQQPAPRLQTPNNNSSNAAGLRRVSPVSPTGSGVEPSAPDDANDFGASILSGRDNDSERASIGITVSPPADGSSGIEITQFSPDSLADDAGLKVGDVITSVNGRPIQTSSDVAAQLVGLRNGERVQIQFNRNQTPYRVTIPLIARKANDPAPKSDSDKKPAPTATAIEKPADVEPTLAEPNKQKLNTPEFKVAESMQAEPTLAAPKQAAKPEPASSVASVASVAKPVAPQPKLTEPKPSDLTETVALPSPVLDSPRPFGVNAKNVKGVRGAVITEVSPGSPAANAGIIPGDRIVSINGRLLMNSDSLFRQMDNRISAGTVIVQLVRDTKLVATEVSFTADPIPAKTGERTKEVASDTDSKSSTLNSLLGGLFGSKAEVPEKSSDEMAFGDNEPVKRAGFNEPVKTATPQSPPPTDPPSLDDLEAPTGAAAETKADPSKAETELLKKIRELESQLERLKGTE
ncbi:PDZ domain-containing protein [Rubripirellula reticaptiva]|uniref:PDZ domain-containing protein n=1 Tax=Rubripirellula reticaptiva TaxID=2528013 RepID=UPI0016495F9E|nr:PDZ domain-containing protein [Rubripirellula reticaptiva]